MLAVACRGQWFLKKWFFQIYKMCNIGPYSSSWRWYGLSTLNNFPENTVPHRRASCKKIRRLITDPLHDSVSQTEFNSVTERTLLILFELFISPFYKSHCFSIWWIQCLTREFFHRKSIFCNIIVFLHRTIKLKNISYYHWFDYGMLYSLDFSVCQLISFTDY